MRNMLLLLSMKEYTFLISIFIYITLACGNQNKAEKIPLFFKAQVNVVDTFVIPQPSGFVTDLAHLFNANEKRVLDSLISSYEKRTTVQIALLTFDSSYTSIRDFEKFTLTVLNTWGVGVKGKNNGILIAICPEYRMIRIENGYGIEKVLSNEETKQIIQDHILPYLKEGKYFDGVVSGIQRLTSVLDGKFKT